MRLLGPSWVALGASWGRLGPPKVSPEAPRGSPGGSRRASGTSFWEHFCCKACRHDKSKKNHHFLCIFDVVFMLFLAVLLRLPRCAGASAHLEKYWFSPGGYCKFRLSAVFARNEKRTNSMRNLSKNQLENASNKACRKTCKKPSKITKKHQKCIPKSIQEGSGGL